jgi:hypothetical protein
MSKKSPNTICTNKSKSLSGWDAAITDAQEQIEEAKRRISRLRQAIKTFEGFRDRGEPFFGNSPKETEAQP